MYGELRLILAKELCLMHTLKMLGGEPRPAELRLENSSELWLKLDGERWLMYVKLWLMYKELWLMLARSWGAAGHSTILPLH